MRGTTNLMMLLTFIFVLLMTLFNGGTKALPQESVNNTSSIDNQSQPSTGSKLLDSLLAKNMCAGKKVNAMKFNYRDSFLIYDKGHRLFRRRKESMMRCLQDAVKRNLTYSPYDFNKNFLEYEYPDTSACTEYQYVITAQSVQNFDYIKLKVGDIDNIEIYAIMPNGCMDMVFIENFLHENLARVTRLFEEKIPRFNQSINQVSVLESSGPEDHIVNFFQLFGSAVHKIYKDLVKQDDEFTIKGPGTLLYLLSRYMECHAKKFFPKYLRDALDEIEYINGFWFDFDVRKRTTDRNQNVTIFIDRKAAQFSYDVAFTDLYKVISVYVNDKYMDNKKLFGKILSEHYYMNRDPTCELQKNDQEPKLLQNESSNKTIELSSTNE